MCARAGLAKCCLPIISQALYLIPMHAPAGLLAVSPGPNPQLGSKRRASRNPHTLDRRSLLHIIPIETERQLRVQVYAGMNLVHHAIVCKGGETQGSQFRY